MTLHLFTREYRCFECGRVARYAWREDAVCCARQMASGSGEGAPGGVGQRIDLVKPIDAARSLAIGGLRPELDDVWEVWLLMPGRKTATSERIGWMGCGALGMWEWKLVAGLRPNEGLAVSREEAAVQMEAIAAGGIHPGTIRA